MRLQTMYLLSDDRKREAALEWPGGPTTNNGEDDDERTDISEA